MSETTPTQSKELFRKFAFEQPRQEPLPPPPYQVGQVSMNFVGVRFRPDAIRALLPPELSPRASCTGTICVYSVGSGWGVGEFSACFAAIEVNGHDAPDGSPGYYIAAGYYSGRGLEFMRQYYNLNAVQGASRQQREGEHVLGIGGPDGVDAITMRLRPIAVATPSAAGVHHYLGSRPGGGTNLFAIAFAGSMVDAEPIAVSIADSASERMKLARPVELIYALQALDGSLTFGPPRPITDPPHELASEAAKTSLLNAFSGIGRAAILVDANGRVSVMNREAEILLGDGIIVRQGQLKSTLASEQPSLDRVIAAATNEGVGYLVQLDPIAVTRTVGRPLIIEAIPIDPAVTGAPAALLFVNDPARETAMGSRAPALRLFGLTAAEARVAELVGSGLSPREAAQRLENSENTVRSSLKQIYLKLDINRAAELARLVARL